MASPDQSRSPTITAPARGDDGFMLLTALVMVFLVLLVLSVAAPRIAKSIQRDRELESEHRAQQYVRAIRIFYTKFKRYPTSLDQLEKTNNQRFLRQRYVDPLTGKDDWRLIHVGENKTQVKGFFGEDLPGLATGLGSAAGMSSTTGGSAFGSSGGLSPASSAFGSGNASGSAFGSNSAGGTAGATGSSAFGQTGTTPGATTTGATTTGATTTGATTPGMGGISSQSATSFTGSGGAGPIMGIGSAKSGEAMLVVNEQTTYDTWEFLYDPRIEQLYAKSTLLGGISSGSGSSSGFGNGTSTGNGFGNPGSLGFGNSNNPGGGTTFGSPVTPVTPATPTTPTTPGTPGTNPPGVP